MLLFELDNTRDVTLIAVINQLKQGIKDGEVNPKDYSVKNLLRYLREYDVIVDEKKLYDMIKEPPMDDLIHNIANGMVVFKGYADDSAMDQPEDEDKKTVAKMANHALKK